MDNTIVQRINRIYAAIGDTEEDDPNKLKATVVQTDKAKVIFQDFRGDLSHEDLSNYAHTVIHNIANLQDNLKQWASQNGRGKSKVEQIFKNSFDLQIIQDLSNNDKHGYPSRRSYSGKYPKLVDIKRVMQLQTQAKKGSTVGMTFGTDGATKFYGDGSAKAIITGDVVDNHNNRIGEFHGITMRALEAWEVLLDDFRLVLLKKVTQ